MRSVKYIAGCLLLALMLVGANPCMAEGFSITPELALDNQMNDLSPSAGEMETLDEALDLALPDKWSMNLNVRDRILNSNKNYFERNGINKRDPSSDNVVVGIGLGYKF